MTIFCKSTDLVSESDVEQKLIWQFLTAQPPLGLGFSPAEIHTKHSIRSLMIDKGDKAHLYFPDYAAVLAGLPVLIVEAKKPTESADDGLREARLYASELNVQFPSGLNPCIRVIASNGRQLVSAAWDSRAGDCLLDFDAITAASAAYAEFVSLNCRSALDAHAYSMLNSLTRRPFYLPLAILGGRTVRNEEVGHNTFGATLALDYKHLFNPITRDERAFIVKHAYVRSLRRDRYVEPIDRLVRAASPPSVTDARLIEDTSKPEEIIAHLREHKSLEHQVLLLVGGVGAGKSTFVDYFSEVALSDDLRDRTTWIRLDLNYAPVAKDEAYRWVTDEMIAELRRQRADLDFDDLETIKKVYSVELAKLSKGPLKVLDPTSTEYKTRWVDAVQALQRDHLLTAKATIRYICGATGKLLILVFDNCDKRTRDEQLLMFQLAQWAQQEFRCLIFLPIRDVTYDHHRLEPPLDTAIKDLVFRIEPPQFAKVLQQRVKLALTEMSRVKRSRILTYELPNGIRVEYPRSDQGMYLAAILRSLYEYDRLIRRTITGLAGRDIRRAMEIFLEFCTSGHIGEHEILKIRQSEGAYTLPYEVVVRVLLRMNRRFYEGDQSYIKNLFQCRPADARPDVFCRLAILIWLRRAWPLRGPTGIKGYHQVETLIKDLVPGGHDANVVRRELLYLVRAQCVMAEHQRTDAVEDDDLICLAPAGVVHLDLARNADYLAACAEETWYSEGATAHAIAERIGGGGPRAHYSRVTTLANARDFAEFLEAKVKEDFPCPTLFLKQGQVIEEEAVFDAARAVRRAAAEDGIDLYVGNLPWRINAPDLELLFADHVRVVTARVAQDSASGRSLGWGVVRVSRSDVDEAIARIDGACIDGRTLKVRRWR